MAVTGDPVTAIAIQQYRVLPGPKDRRPVKLQAI